MSESLTSAPSIDVRNFLSNTELFRNLDPVAVEELARGLERIHLASGETLIHQGERGDCLYVLVNGRLRVVVEHADGSETTVGEVARGEVVGEMALLTDEPRSATVKAIRDSELVMFSKEMFERALQHHPQAMMQIARQIIVRLHRTIRAGAVANTVSTLTVVPAGTGGPLEEFTQRLAESLEHFGSTIVLDSNKVEEHLGKGAAETPQYGPGNNKVLAWLNEQESKYKFVIFQADTTPSNWTRRCLRQADRVLAVTQAGGDPALNRIEEEIARYGRKQAFARTDLVFLHDASTERPSGTEPWVARRQATTVHHLRIHQVSDYQRLARILTGRAVGVVLGGGGARGLSHVGVLKAILELGIPIDVIGGTSMGAIISGLYAMDRDIERAYETCRAGFVKEGSLLDFTFPAVALTSGTRITSKLKRFFGETRIEDLWLNYYCVSSNLTRAEVAVHRSGPAWRRIRASISLPGVMPPVFDQGDLLVDGGVMNNLPVDVMRNLCDGGTVIALDVSPKIDLTQKEPFGEGLSGWKILRKRVNPFASTLDVPTIASVLMRTTLLGSASSQNMMARQADICLCPPVEKFGLLEFKSFDEIAQIGYDFAMKELEGWYKARC